MLTSIVPGGGLLFIIFPTLLGGTTTTATVEQQEWDLFLSRRERGSGWTELGTLYVEVPGKSQVTVNNDSSAEYVFADAIKWKYLD